MIFLKTLSLSISYSTIRKKEGPIMAKKTKNRKKVKLLIVSVLDTMWAIIVNCTAGALSCTNPIF